MISLSATGVGVLHVETNFRVVLQGQLSLTAPFQSLRMLLRAFSHAYAASF